MTSNNIIYNINECIITQPSSKKLCLVVDGNKCRKPHLCREWETLEHPSLVEMALSHPFSQCSGGYAEEEVERLQGPEVVDNFKKLGFSRHKRYTYEFTRACDSIHKTFINSSQTKSQHWQKNEHKAHPYPRIYSQLIPTGKYKIIFLQWSDIGHFSHTSEHALFS